jgi:hypothetical protein
MIQPLEPRIRHAHRRAPWRAPNRFDIETHRANILPSRVTKRPFESRVVNADSLTAVVDLAGLADRSPRAKDGLPSEARCERTDRPPSLASIHGELWWASFA